MLQTHSEGTSLRGISRVSGLAYNTVVSIVRASSAKALLVHNDRVQQVTSSVVTTDEMWLCRKYFLVTNEVSRSHSVKR